jgi:DNA processing protein
VSPETLRACEACRLRTRLLAELAGHLDRRSRERRRLAALLALSDERLLDSVGARQLDVTTGETQGRGGLPGAGDPRGRRPAGADPSAAGPGAELCRHDSRYPEGLRALSASPAVLHLGGEPGRVLALLQAPAVALVGARSPTDYGRAVGRELAAALASSGVCVVSGMAMGVDAEAHAGALGAGGPTLAVLPGGVDIAYPAAARALHRRLLGEAGAVSEMPRGMAPRRWCFVARNRIVAGLARVTIVVEARERSGTLITAGYARDLGRDVAAVPGPVSSSLSAGTNALIRDGAHLVRGAADVLDLLYGVGARPPAAPALDPRLAGVLERVRSGQDTPEALATAGLDLDEALAALAELELLGRARRGLSGREAPVAA